MDRTRVSPVEFGERRFLPPPRAADQLCLGGPVVDVGHCVLVRTGPSNRRSRLRTTARLAGQASVAPSLASRCGVPTSVQPPRWCSPRTRGRCKQARSRGARLTFGGVDRTRVGGGQSGHVRVNNGGWRGLKK